MPAVSSRTDLHTHSISTLTCVRDSRTSAPEVSVTSNQPNGIALSARANTKKHWGLFGEGRSSVLCRQHILPNPKLPLGRRRPRNVLTELQLASPTARVSRLKRKRQRQGDNISDMNTAPEDIPRAAARKMSDANNRSALSASASLMCYSHVTAAVR